MKFKRQVGIIKDLDSGSHPERLPLWGVALLAAASLILESSLTRFLAVAQYYHFAFLAISLALLGFGASGTILGFLPILSSQDINHQQGLRVTQVLAFAGVGFTLLTGLAYLIINFLPFDSYSIAWDRRQVFLFFLYYLVLTGPFLFAGLGIGAALSGHLKESHLVYTANLLGSAVGVIGAPVLMWLAGVPGALLAAGVMGLTSTILSAKSIGIYLHRFIRVFILVLTIGFLSLAMLNFVNKSPLGMKISPYKGLSYALRIPGAARIYGRWNALSRIDVLSGAATRVLPGLSYTYNGDLPQQLGMAIDGDTLLPIPLVTTDKFEAGEYLPEAIAFKLRPRAEVLILEPHGGMAVLQAIAEGAHSIVAVSSNALEIRAAMASTPGKSVFQMPGVQSIIQVPRSYLDTQPALFSLVYVPLTDPYRPVGSGAYSLTENYLFTVESFRKILSRLNEDGILVVTRWLQTPPSEEVKLLATLLEAMKGKGVRDPGDTLVAYRGIQTMTILVQSRGWGKDELKKIREFLESRKYDLVWAPDIKVDEINRYNKLEEPYYYLAFKGLITTADKLKYYSEYPFNIQPATDNRPFFYNFFKWSQTPQVLSSIGHTWQPFGGSGYLVLIALLFLVVILSTILIGVPAIWHGFITLRQLGSNHVVTTTRTRANSKSLVLYFGCIGLGYLLVEIPLIQRAILWFGNPISAFTLIVAVLLVFSGLGSYFSNRAKTPLWIILISLAGLVIIVTSLSYLLDDVLLALPLVPRMLSVGIMIAPLGFLMGFPFPSGVRSLVTPATRQATLAWAVNGCASVIAAVLAAILALEFGFNLVLLIGACFYSFAIFGLIGDKNRVLSSARQ